MQDQTFEVNGLPKNDRAGGKQVLSTSYFQIQSIPAFFGDMSNLGNLLMLAIIASSKWKHGSQTKPSEIS